MPTKDGIDFTPVNNEATTAPAVAQSIAPAIENDNIDFTPHTLEDGIDFTPYDQQEEQAASEARAQQKILDKQRDYDKRIEGEIFPELAGASSNLEDHIHFLNDIKNIVQPEDYRDYRKYAANKFAEKHPVLNALSGGLGVLDTAALGGELINPITESIGLTGLAKSATEGVLFNAEPIGHKLIEGDYTGAGVEALGGALGGAALHGLGKLGEFGAAKLSEKLEARVLESEIAERAGIVAKDDSETAIAKLNKYKNETFSSAARVLDDSKEAGVAAQDAIHKSQSEIERLLPASIAERAAAEAELSRAENALKSVKSADETPAAYEAFQAAKAALNEVPALSKSELAQKQIFDKINTKLSEAADSNSFVKANEVSKYLNDNASKSNIFKAASDALNKNLLEAQTNVVSKSIDPKIVEAIKQSSTIDNIIGELKNPQPLPKGSGKILHTPSALSLIHLAFSPASGAAHVAASVIKGTLANGLRAVGRSSAARSILDSATPLTDSTIHLIQEQGLSVAKGTKSLFEHFNSSTPAKAVVFNGIRDFLPDNGRGLSQPQQFSTLRKNVSDSISNPEAFANKIAPITDAMKAEGLDKLAEGYTDHQLKILKFIDAILPEDPNIQAVHPFSAKVQAKDISPAVKERVNRALTLANNPLTILDLIKSNTITKSDVAIVAALNPMILQKMREAAVDEALKSKPDLSYQQRLSMGIFMGTNLDESTAELPVLQSIYVAPPPSGTSGKPKSSKTSAKTENNLQNSVLTLSQQAAGHGQS